jgi:hypothetical protein
MKYNPLCDADEESTNDMLKELDIHSDNDMDLEIEGKIESEGSSNKM